MTATASLVTRDRAGDGERVTIVIAVYNGRRYIDQAIRSALAQTHHDVEIIVVDDASTDGTADHVDKSYGKKIRLLENAHNLGPSASRNRAISIASGDWIMQLDGDDWLAPTRCEKLLALAHRTGADIVSDDQALFQDGSGLIVSSRFIENNLPWRSFEELSVARFIQHDLGSLKPMLRASLLRSSDLRYPEALRIGEDFVFLLSLMRYGARFFLLSEPLYFMRRGNTGSLTTRRHALFDQLIVTTRQMLDDSLHRADAEGTYIADALTLRLRRLQRLERAEGGWSQLRNRRLPGRCSWGPIAEKCLHRLQGRIRLWMLMRRSGPELERLFRGASGGGESDSADR